jgi:hypothetical protein
MAMNTTTAVEITLCRPVSRTVHRAAPGTLGMLITWHSLCRSQAWILAFGRKYHQGTGVKMTEISRKPRCW